MNQQKNTEFLSVRRVVLIFIAMLSLLLVVTTISVPRLRPFIYGYCIGTDGTLYLGKGSVVEVYRDNIFMEEFRPPTEQRYLFQLHADDRFSFYLDKRIIQTDKSLKQLSDEPDPQWEQRSQMSVTEVTGLDGNQYTMKNIWGYQLIYRLDDNAVVYSENVGLYILSILCLAAIVFVVCFMFFMVIKAIQLRNNMLCRDKWSYYDW